MKPVKTNGFTIVETMLFLGISGLLIMGVLVGTGTSINIQRYHDSVTSLQSTLQQQYSNVANVSNDVMNNTCGGSENNRGQSNCVILGKYITTSDGKTLDIKDVLGSGTSTTPDDLVALKDYNPFVSTESIPEKYDVSWGASVVQPGSDNVYALSMLILRSPSSGIIRTFINSDSTNVVSDADIGTILKKANLIQSAKLCVNSNGLFTGNKMAIFVNSNTTSAGGIELLGDNNGC
jgi:type II secretory pathway pseudopilin PulG